MKKILALLLAFAFAASAEDGDLTNDQIIRELRGGGTEYKPNWFIFNVKPISFIVGQSAGKVAPYPMKCLQAKGRLFGNLGIQAEPVFVVGGYGGFGFTAGPAYFPKYPWDDIHIAGKYELDYINRMGAYHGFMLEMTRHRLFKFFVLTYGGAIGLGVTGASVSTDFNDKLERILEVNQGFAFDVNLGLGFAL